MKYSIFLFITILFLGIFLLLVNQVVKAEIGEAVQDIGYMQMVINIQPSKNLDTETHKIPSLQIFAFSEF
jgi:hypothetical protein